MAYPRGGAYPDTHYLIGHAFPYSFVTGMDYVQYKVGSKGVSNVPCSHCSTYMIR